MLTPARLATQKIIVLTLLYAFLVVGIVGLARAVYDSHAQYRTEWIADRATVTSLSVRTISSGDRAGRTPDLVADVIYSYIVGDVALEGAATDETLLSDTSNNEKYVRDKYVTGAKITIFYAANDFKKTTLESPDQLRSDFIMYTTLLGVMCLILIVAICIHVRRCRHP